MRYRVLIVDDETDSREALAELTQRWGYDVQTASDGTEALRRAIEGHPDVILTDLVMPNMDGLWLLRALRAELPDCPVVLLTGRGTIQTAVQAIREGAFDFIEKPLEVPRLRLVLERALEKKETMREVQLLRRRIAALAPGTDMIGSGPAMQRVFELVKKVSPSNASVVIAGESGTGKEVVARAIHNLSPRKDKPFVALNCSAIPATLIESELFGYERGAFTGADQRRLGNFELAHNGTLFLDEIGELPLELQAKFLRVLEERKIRRLGGRSEVEVDVRVICATNRDLKEEIRRGRFREDLYFRLHVFSILLPTLKERREDVPLLVHHFIEKFNAETGKRVQGVSPAAMAVLQGYAWPGNIRELRNTVERAMILVDGEVIGEEQLPPDMPASRPEAATLRVPLGLHIDKVEKEYILASLQRNGGNKARTAEILGISEKTLYNKLNRYAAEARSRGEASEGDPAAAGGAKA
ncbi:two component, sigma54 specific, transcriptional regulator, Fis family [Anaeromyxobacter dehalogenans 2CP-1]|uniref:Two component, sigma54 specific, transcriptional regulator, Fis family n=1 Tax=Anaeromyxobacter dehalogenans (strain ATCC BAA-258 / DSM 21875 / 2CP-1) TaxID=455488 RepID=B8JBA9_ANAD2|nr:sigma-54 dependent transcriptional regulator [Anaeromyxobacter dehalogenans]ACL65736.1 two component, sigma54 specific, transcriptional regulator, Fis family [Anaeromyxobacter dehalogenans 2CP-1]